MATCQAEVSHVPCDDCIVPYASYGIMGCYGIEIGLDVPKRKTNPNENLDVN